MAEYTSDQLIEIEEGKKAHIDTSIYENPDFLAIQMRQIRFALNAGLDVKPYVTNEYDWMQMEEIFTGLEQQVDVSLLQSLRYLTKRCTRYARDLQGASIYPEM